MADTYEDLLAENAQLRARIAELTGRDAIASPIPNPKKFKPHPMDVNAEDSFRRPAYSRRTT